jgi:hypothetical protein
MGFSQNDGQGAQPINFSVNRKVTTSPVDQNAPGLSVAFDDRGQVAGHSAISMKLVKEAEAAGHNPATSKALIYPQLADIAHFFNLTIHKKRAGGATGYSSYLSRRLMSSDQHLAKVAHCAATQKIIRLSFIGHSDSTGYGIVSQQPPDSWVVGGGGEFKDEFHSINSITCHVSRVMCQLSPVGTLVERVL